MVNIWLMYGEYDGWEWVSMVIGVSDNMDGLFRWENPNVKWMKKLGVALFQETSTMWGPLNR